MNSGWKKIACEKKKDVGKSVRKQTEIIGNL